MVPLHSGGGDRDPSAGPGDRDGNAIRDFRRLDLTVAKVGFERAEGGADAAGGGYVEYAVDGRTVDLTGLRGPNAVRIASFDVPPGTYRRAVAYVSRARGTLRDGDRVSVALPDGPLAVARRLTVAEDGTTDAVTVGFDVAVRRTDDGYALSEAGAGAAALDAPDA